MLSHIKSLLLFYFMIAHRGKTIIKSILIICIIGTFAYLYSLIREPFSNRRHTTNNDMNQVPFVFTCMLLLLIGMPIIR